MLHRCNHCLRKVLLSCLLINCWNIQLFFNLFHQILNTRRWYHRYHRPIVCIGHIVSLIFVQQLLWDIAAISTLYIRLNPINFRRFRPARLLLVSIIPLSKDISISKILTSKFKFLELTRSLFEITC